LMGLDRHYDRASIEARRTKDGYRVETANVRSLILMHEDIPKDAATKVRCDVDGQIVEANDGGRIGLTKSDGRWKAIGSAKLWRVAPEKSPGFQGPIDDAFCRPFLCVRGTGTPWHPAVGRYADGELDRFVRTWDKNLRGKLRVKDDTAITDEDVRGKNLILFG